MAVSTGGHRSWRGPVQHNSRRGSRPGEVPRAAQFTARLTAERGPRAAAAHGRASSSRAAQQTSKQHGRRRSRGQAMARVAAMGPSDASLSIAWKTPIHFFILMNRCNILHRLLSLSSMSQHPPVIKSTRPGST
jgi:hypothetical protein